MRRSVMWIPVLMMGSLLFWTVAINAGWLSVIALTACPLDDEVATAGPLTVELTDVEETTPADDAAAVIPVDVQVEPRVRAEQGGETGRNGAADAVNAHAAGPGSTAF